MRCLAPHRLNIVQTLMRIKSLTGRVKSKAENNLQGTMTIFFAQD